MPTRSHQDVAGYGRLSSTHLDIVEGRRERVTVEIFISGEAVDRWWVKPCYYFEKYPNGRIERFDRFGWQDAVLWLFLLGGIAGAFVLAVKVVRSLW